MYDELVKRVRQVAEEVCYDYDVDPYIAEQRCFVIEEAADAIEELICEVADEHNVDKGIPIHSLIDSAIRHTIKFWLGWDDEPHLTAACWNLLWALNMMLVKPEMDDRPGRES